MFQWDKSMTNVSAPAGKVVNLFRSMRDVQMALPGVPAQLATAFLCQYQEAAGVATIAVFHLHKSRMLAFYCSDPRVVPAAKSDGMLDQGLNFVESMGFLLTDQDFQLLDPPDQEMLWNALPLVTGLDEGEAPAAAAGSGRNESSRPGSRRVEGDGEPVAPKESSTPAAPAGNDAAPQPEGPAAGKTSPAAAAKPDPAQEVDDLLAAVDALRNRRSGLRTRRAPPSAPELARRRSDLCHAVGRILASL